jgi:hypothetical protein
MKAWEGPMNEASICFRRKIHNLRRVRARLAIIIMALEALAQVSPNTTRRRNRKQATGRLKLKSKAAASARYA